MSPYKVWSSRVIALLCLGLVGLVWVPATANAATPAQQWAVVSFKGKLVRTNGATSATRTSRGRYLVTFKTSLAKCAFEATVGDTADGGIEFPVVTTVGQPEGKPKVLFIQTFAEGTQAKLQDRPFHVTAYCGASARFAVVNSDGSKARASHLVSSTRSGDGAYALVFDRDVRTCVFTASIGSAIPGEVLTPGNITVDALAGNNNGVFVQTVSPQGLDTDFPFHLAVNCAPGPLIAVVNADGTTARGNNVVSSAKPFPGQNGLYEVIFNRNVTGCAYTATVSAASTPGAVDAPVAITTGSREGKVNGVFVATDNPLLGLVDVPFHLTVTC